MNRQTLICLAAALLILGGFATYLPAAEEAPSARALTLREAMRMAKQKNETILSTDEDIYQAGLNKRRAASVLMPQISAEGSYTWIESHSKQKVFAGGGGGGDTGGEPTEPSDMDIEGAVQEIDFTQYFAQQQLGATLVQPLINLEAWPLWNQAKINIDVQEAVRRSTIDSIYLAVAEAYLNVLGAQKGVTLAEKSVARLEEHLRAAKAKLEVGEVIKTAVLQADIELHSAQNQLRQARNGEVIGEAALANLIGVSGPYSLAEPEAVPGETPRLAEALDLALENRGDLQAASQNLRFAHEQKNQTYTQFLPTLNGVLSYSYSDSDSLFGSQNQTYTAGLQLSVPIFNGGLRFWQLNEDSSRIEQARLGIEETKKKIRLEVERALLQLETDRDLVENTRRKLELAQENYELVTAQFDVGLATSLDVLDSQTFLADAELELIRQEYTYHLQYLTLKQATGRLAMDLEDNEE